MEPTFASRIERLRGHMEVPAAAILFSGFALALFAWPGSGPSKAPEAVPAAIRAETEALPPVRRIAITGEAPPQAAPAAAPSVALAELPGSPAPGHDRNAGKGAEPKPERPAAKRAAAPARQPSPGRLSPQARQMASAVPVGQGAGRAEARLVPAPAAAGILDRTLTLGSAAVEIAAGGADYARSAAFRLGRSVASLIDEHI